MTERITTTHVGSLPRPQALTQMMWKALDGEPVDAEALDREIPDATHAVVRRQSDLGIDVISDGEMGRFGFTNYFYQGVRK